MLQDDDHTVVFESIYHLDRENIKDGYIEIPPLGSFLALNIPTAPPSKPMQLFPFRKFLST
jgi:hypothetical protein